MRRLTADRPILSMTSELGQVMAAARAREQAGERVIHLERGEPDFDTPSNIIEGWPRRRGRAKRTIRTRAARCPCARSWSRSWRARTVSAANPTTSL